MAATPPFDPTESNPIMQVANAGYTDAAAEREQMLAELRHSGAAYGDWLEPANGRLNDVEDYIRNAGLGTVSSLGCWAAGCSAKVVFRDDASARELEELGDPGKKGTWPYGTIITAPRDLGDGGPTSYVFFLAPERP